MDNNKNLQPSDTLRGSLSIQESESLQTSIGSGSDLTERQTTFVLYTYLEGHPAESTALVEEVRGKLEQLEEDAKDLLLKNLTEEIEAKISESVILQSIKLRQNGQEELRQELSPELKLFQARILKYLDSATSDMIQFQHEQLEDHQNITPDSLPSLSLTFNPNITSPFQQLLKILKRFKAAFFQLNYKIRNYLLLASLA